MVNMPNQQGNLNTQTNNPESMDSNVQYILGDERLPMPAELDGIVTEEVWNILNANQKKEILVQRNLFQYLVKSDIQKPDNYVNYQPVQPNYPVNPNIVNSQTPVQPYPQQPMNPGNMPFRTPENANQQFNAANQFNREVPANNEFSSVQPQVSREVAPTVQISEMPALSNEQVQLNSEFAKEANQIKEMNAVHEATAASKDVNKERLTDISKLNTDDKERIMAETAANVNKLTFNFFGFKTSQNVASNAVQISDTGNVSDGKTWTATIIKKLLAIFNQ